MTPLRNWPGPARLLATLFVLSLCGGWAAALLNIRAKSTDSGRLPFTVDSVIDRYRGEGWTDASAGEGAMSYNHLMDLTHVHSFSMPILFFLLGALFCLSSCQEGAMRLLLAASFSDLWINMGSLWAIRYAPQPRLWAWVLILSGVVMSLAFAAMAFFALRDLLCRNQPPPMTGLGTRSSEPFDSAPLRGDLARGRPGNLLDLPLGAWGQIDSLSGDEEVQARLSELGFTPGEWVRVTAKLPFGGAFSVNLRGGVFALRREEAACVKLQGVAP